MALEAVRIEVPFDALDIHAVNAFLRWARTQIRIDAPPGSVVDVVLGLDGVEFVMAAGVQALLDLEADLERCGQTLRVAGAAPIVARVLEICGVATRWAVT